MSTKMQSVEKIQKLPCFADTYSRKPITDVFTNDTDIDKRGQKRTVPMKVLLLAVGRTGTACKSSVLPSCFTMASGSFRTNTVSKQPCEQP